MNRVFADSFYFFALLNNTDAAHDRARAYTSDFDGQMITTGWILAEVGDGLAKPAHRRKVFCGLWNDVHNDPGMIVIPTSDEWLYRGMALFQSRLDKEWSLTDCISFEVMRAYGLRESLTGDHHFDQAGFVAVFAT